jgi:hypothetical protein
MQGVQESEILYYQEVEFKLLLCPGPMACVGQIHYDALSLHAGAA